MTLNLNTANLVYTFTLYPIDTKFNRIAGIYIFLIIPPMAETLETTELIRSQIPPLKRVGGCENQHPAPCHPEQACAERSRSIEEQQYSLLYIGITNNLYARFNQHHKIKQAIELGMTHIGVLKISSGRKRKKIEREILRYLNPPLNQTWLYDYS